MTQAELATAIGVGKRTITGWENGETIPRNRMGMLERFFSVDDGGGGSEIRGLPDSALLGQMVRLSGELMRRAVEREQGSAAG